ncbi:MAG: pseudaminic acid biosynthesis-associated methylase [Cytophagaceae bacterium]|nr:pseudaminic acid biosynthesis-associated methylase [Cytophagaceae bacterium]
MNFQTDQEEFWAGTFGDEYIQRNRSAEYLASNIHFFAKALHRITPPSSILEFGANVGMNLKAIQQLYPSAQLHGIEINQSAATELASLLGSDHVYHGSIFDFPTSKKVDLTLIKGVLIHIHPDKLGTVYEKLYECSHRYILIGEYYNPSPVSISYRGHSDRLYKRDFAGEMLERYSDLRLLDYGFAYRRDPAFPQDDITWFLLEKKI